MNKISAREIQVFVAGAFALIGFNLLRCLPSSLSDPIHNFWWFARLAAYVIAGLALPIGIAIFFRKAHAILWTQIYLWSWLVLGSISMIGVVVKLGYKAMSMVETAAPGMIVCIVLLWLISWSRSRRFRHEPDA
jgi:hypothetical protein